MAFKSGQKKIGGRSKGTPNKKTLQFQEVLEKHNFDPAEQLLYIFKEQMDIYEKSKKSRRNQEGKISALTAAQKTANDICQYVYPKKKAIEHSGEVNFVTFADFVKAGEHDE